jgi:hypothetical protein
VYGGVQLGLAGVFAVAAGIAVRGGGGTAVVGSFGAGVGLGFTGAATGASGKSVAATTGAALGSGGADGDAVCELAESTADAAGALGGVELAERTAATEPTAGAVVLLPADTSATATPRSPASAAPPMEMPMSAGRERREAIDAHGCEAPGLEAATG